MGPGPQNFEAKNFALGVYRVFQTPRRKASNAFYGVYTLRPRCKSEVEGEMGRVWVIGQYMIFLLIPGYRETRAR